MITRDVFGSNKIRIINLLDVFKTKIELLLFAPEIVKEIGV